MAEVEILVRNEQAQVRIPTGLRTLIRKCCRNVLVEEGFNEKAEISVSFVSNERIKALNKAFRGTNKVTDVLSFPLGSGGVYDKNLETNAFLLGDIVISLEKAFAQCKEYGHSFDREVAFLATHSVLHLLGYDHQTKEENEIMRGKEEKILAMLDLKR